jgi:hypothetical protein
MVENYYLKGSAERPPGIKFPIPRVAGRSMQMLQPQIGSKLQRGGKRIKMKSTSIEGKNLLIP